MGFDIKLLWNFPIGILRLVAMAIGVTAIGLISSGYFSNFEKEKASLALVTICCIGTVGITAVLVSGLVDVSSKKIKKVEFIFTGIFAILVLIAGILMLMSVFNDRPKCNFGTKSNPCQESFVKCVAGAAVSITNTLVYAVLTYYLIKKL